MKIPSILAQIIYTVGPDEQAPGVAYGSIAVNTDGRRDNYGDTGGSEDDLRGVVETPDDWLSVAKDLIAIPSQIADLGLDWEDAVVAPFGWSQGSGHAPGGITITWGLETARAQNKAARVQGRIDGAAAVAEVVREHLIATDRGETTHALHAGDWDDAAISAGAAAASLPAVIADYRDLSDERREVIDRAYYTAYSEGADDALLAIDDDQPSTQDAAEDAVSE